MTTINLPTCIDCDRVVRTPGYCHTCALAIELAKRSAEAAARARRQPPEPRESESQQPQRESQVRWPPRTPLEAAGFEGDELRRARQALEAINRQIHILDEDGLVLLLRRPSVMQLDNLPTIIPTGKPSDP